LGVAREVFTRELGVISGDLDNKNSDWDIEDEWDAWAYSVLAKVDGVVAGTGRLIWAPPKHLGFRVSSSIDIKSYFITENIAEISGLSVLPERRHSGIGTAIHYLRFMIAGILGADVMTASASKDTQRHLARMGFRVMCDNFTYRHYESSQSKRTFLALMMNDFNSVEKFKMCVRRKCSKTMIKAVEHIFELEIKQGLDYLPLK
jgi:hypothetical protein